MAGLDPLRSQLSEIKLDVTYFYMDMFSRRVLDCSLPCLSHTKRQPIDAILSAGGNAFSRYNTTEKKNNNKKSLLIIRYKYVES